MGVGLEIIHGSEPTVALGVLLGSVATFIIVRVLVRVFPTEGTSVFSVGLLAIDLILSLALTVLTDGRDSPFLIYSLGPILVASRLMNLPSAMFAAIALKRRGEDRPRHSTASDGERGPGECH